MIYAKVLNGLILEYPISSSVLKRQNPNTSFPAGELSAATMLEFWCHPVSETSAPFDPNTQRLIEGTPAFVNGQWQQVWVVVDLTAQEIADRNSEKWAEIREQRNELLASSDWTQLSDAPVDQSAWASYRQELRDITDQLSFPWDVVWPTQPE